MSGQPLFGNWLRRRRTGLGVTRDELSEQLGFSLDTLKKLEAGERRPSGQIAHLLADYFRVPPDEREAFVTFARTGQVNSAAGETEPGDGAGSSHAPWRRAFTRHTNLPASLTPLIGRDGEVRALGDLLTNPKTRLVTLIGAPGIGKTRLALQVASSMLEHFEDGVILVELAPVVDPDLVLHTIARTLGLKETGDQPSAGALLEFVRERRMLLVLDNFEQVLDAAPAVVRLLETSPWLKVLATSREPFHTRGERRFSVPPLPWPELSQVQSPHELLAYPSIELFVERARMSRSDFVLTEQNGRVVTRICAALDGLPLSIELAAGHLGFLSPSEIEARLESRLQLLKTRARDLPDRQRTLRGSIEWSYNLLSAREQAAFRRLGVFVGGFTIEAAGAVIAGDTNGVATQDPAETLEALLDKSLITYGVSANVQGPEKSSKGVGRLAMLETLREYSLEQLATNGEEEETRDRHARYYLAFVQEEDEHILGREVIGWAERVATEYNNIRETLSWFFDSQEGSKPIDQGTKGGEADIKKEIERTMLGVDLCTALFQFWDGQNYLNDARSWYTKAAERIAMLAGAVNYKGANATTVKRAAELSPSFPSAWARMLTGAGVMAYYQLDYEEARKLNEIGLLIRRGIGDTSGIAASLNNLGNNSGDRGDYATARDYLLESLRISRELDVPWKIWAALSNLGRVETRSGNFAEARTLLEEAIELARRTEMVKGTADALTNLGIVARLEGNHREARADFDEALNTYMELDQRSGRAQALIQLGYLELDLGNFDQAGSLFREGLHTWVELGEKTSIADGLEGLASVASKQGEAGRAARLFGTAERLRETTGMPISLSEHPGYESYLAAAREQVDEEGWRAAWAAGRAMTLDQAIAEA